MGREMDVVTVTGEEWDDLVELREENVRLMNALRDICDWVGRWASPDHPIVTIAKRAMYPTPNIDDAAHNAELTGVAKRSPS